MRRKAVRLIIVMATVIAAAVWNFLYSVPQTPAITGSFVTRVVDGDTIVIEGGERVRLLYIDTPERGKPCYAEATRRMSELIGAGNITLERSGENKDVYGRLLRYVYANNTMVNIVLVREGLAHLYIYNEGPYHQQFLGAEKAAKRENGCVWRK